MFAGEFYVFIGMRRCNRMFPCFIEGVSALVEDMRLREYEGVRRKLFTGREGANREI